MGAFLGVLAAGVVAVLALLTALASASASLASTSTALLTGQCMSGFLGLVSLAAWAGARCAANHLPGD